MLSNPGELSLLDYVLGTGFFLVGVWGIRWLLHRILVHRDVLLGEDRRRRTVMIRNGLLVLIVLGMILIWAPQMQPLAVSLLAIAVALAIATKEIIDCLSGTLLAGRQQGSIRWAIGLKIVEFRGNVVDINLLSTTLLEIGPGQTSHHYTGRAMTIPNRMILQHSVTNESYSKDFRLHIVTVPLSTTENWKEAERILLEAAQEECRSFLEEAKQHMKKLEGRTWLDAPSVEPRVTFQLPEPGRINLLLRIPCKTKYPARVEQAILRRFLSQYSFNPSTNGHNGSVSPSPEHLLLGS